MLGGRAADLLGRRRMFIAGTALFSLSSLGCALATRALLLGARALQGIGGAVLSPATLSIITTSFAEGPRAQPRARRLGRDRRLGASSGALLGGVLTQALGWQAIFAVNVPIGARHDRARPARDARLARREGATRHFDVGGRPPRHRRAQRADLRDRPQRHARLGRRPACSPPSPSGVSLLAAVRASSRARVAERAARAAVDLPPRRSCGPRTWSCCCSTRRSSAMFFLTASTCSRSCTTARSQTGLAFLPMTLMPPPPRPSRPGSSRASAPGGS